jgi:hypothetical protein
LANISTKNLLKSRSLSWTALMLWLIFIIVLWAAMNTSFKKDYKTGVLEADAKGYYAYLPAVFIYHDLNFGFFNQIERVTYYNPNLYYEYLREHNKKTIDKYYAGTAICLLPFFLVGHSITQLTGLPADGYSYYYTMMAHVGALFYFLLALFGLRKLLRLYNFNDKTIAVVLIAIVFGTNLFYYVVTEFGMSHLYSLTAITWFCVATLKYFSEHQNKHLVYIALLLGIITLIRPVNLLVVLAIPFLAGNTDHFREGLKNLLAKKWVLLLALAGFFLILSVQLLIYKISTGSFFVYSYKQEGFNFLNPQIMNFLFSYRKGMFVYTPLLFLSLAGFIYLFRSSRFQFFALLGFLLILVYVFSSWFMWFYGGSFSQRVMIEFYPFFAILLATAIQEIKNKFASKVFLSLIVLLVLVCQVQTFQYRRMQIHWSDMNKEKYWNVFMRIDKL